MNMRPIFTLSALSLLFFFPACISWGDGDREVIQGSSHIIKEDRAVTGFNQIDISGGAILYLSQDDQESLTVEAPDNLLPYLITEVKKNVLHIHPKDEISIRSRAPIKYYVTAKNIKSVQQSGAIKLESEEIKGDKLSLTTSGSASINVTVAVEKLVVDGAGSTTITVRGKATQQDIQLSGSATYKALELESETATINGAGAIKVELNVTDTIKGSLSGFSKLLYRGNPSVQVEQAGSGSIQSVG